MQSDPFLSTTIHSNPHEPIPIQSISIKRSIILHRLDFTKSQFLNVVIHRHKYTKIIMSYQVKELNSTSAVTAIAAAASVSWWNMSQSSDAKVGCKGLLRDWICLPFSISIPQQHRITLHVHQIHSNIGKYQLWSKWESSKEQQGTEQDVPNQYKEISIITQNFIATNPSCFLQFHFYN